jgi:hypothetical protein
VSLLGERIEETLTPIVGTVLASVSVELEAKRLGKTPDTLDRSDLGPLSENLERQLGLVVGQDLAAAAARNVRRLG